jgi:class 3 adenylate cyclase
MVTHQTNRTFICSTVFVDLVEYSKKSVTEQLALKDRFTSLLAEALQGIDVNERIILDTGDGAAMSFLGDPESALFVGMSLRDAFKSTDSADPVATAPIRIGINLGPVKLVKDINGHPNIVGDGINVAQRIMSFADSGQILVSRSFHDVVSCLSDDYAALFRFEGSRTDKHVRDHEVYAVGDSEAALARAKRGVAQRAEPVAPAPRPEASTAAGETLRRAQAAATTFLHDRHKVTLTGGVLGALIVVLAVVLVVRKPAEVRAAAAPAAGAPAQVAAQDAAEKAPAATGAASSAVAAKPAPARPAPAKAEAPTGTVGLAVLPWGEVFVNGRSRGVSPPLKNLKLAPGTYTIEVRNTTFAPLKQKVQVKAREEVTVRHVFK